MTRRDSEGTYAARRAAIFRHLVYVDGFDELDAEDWIARWEREAERRALARLSAAFWDAGVEWIRQERAAQRKHPRRL